MFKNAIIVDIEWLKLWSKRFKNPLEDAETLKFDKYFNLLEIGKKTTVISEIMAQYIGLLKFNKQTLKFINELNLKKKIPSQMYMTDLINLLLKNNIQIKVIPIQRGWIEIDTNNDLEIYNKALTEKGSSVLNLFQ